jgi:3-phytase
MFLARIFVALGLAAVQFVSIATAQIETSATVHIVSQSDIESDWTTVYYYSQNPLLLANDGGAAPGGFHAWSLNSDFPAPDLKHVKTGRTTLVTTAYLRGKGLVVTRVRV